MFDQVTFLETKELCEELMFLSYGEPETKSEDEVAAVEIAIFANPRKTGRAFRRKMAKAHKVPAKKFRRTALEYEGYDLAIRRSRVLKREQMQLKMTYLGDVDHTEEKLQAEKERIEAENLRKQEAFQQKSELTKSLLEVLLQMTVKEAIDYLASKGCKFEVQDIIEAVYFGAAKLVEDSQYSEK